MQKARNIVGPIVRELREKQGLSQAQLAAKINVHGWDISRETLAKIEAQIRWVADFELVKLGEGLGTDAPTLIRQAVAKGGTAAAIAASAD
jgi:transcriptional regulator with XRE-family HTH domain